MSRTIAIARARMPSNFEGLRAISTVADDLSVTRALGCKCGSDKGEIRATPSRHDDLPFLDPVKFICSRCQQPVTFFDSSRDGYDGRLNGGGAYDQGGQPEAIRCDDCGSTEAAATCELLYNVDFEEEGDGELLAQAQDYFDFIEIGSRCAQCGSVRHVGGWEMA